MSPNRVSTRCLVGTRHLARLILPEMAAERLINVERTDFIAVPTRNREPAVDFYERTVGLTRSQTSSETWVAFETPVLFVLGRSPARAGGAHDLALAGFRRRVESS